MIHFSNCASSLRLQAATLSVLVAGLALVSAASAADLNFNVANGNFTTTGNWVDANTFAPAAAAPTFGDNAYVRNGGTVTINTDVAASDIRIGARQSITTPDYNGNGFVDPMTTYCGEKVDRYRTMPRIQASDPRITRFGDIDMGPPPRRMILAGPVRSCGRPGKSPVPRAFTLAVRVFESDGTSISVQLSLPNMIIPASSLRMAPQRKS